MGRQICYLLLLISIALLFVYRVSFRKKQSEDLLSRETTNVLKGHAIILIMIHHMVLRMTAPGILLPFRITGYLGVTLFFFMSGFGLVCASNGREKIYAKGFMLKRICKIYFPALFAQLIYLLVLTAFFDQHDTPHGFLISLFGLYPADTSQWYIIAAFFWYLVFWVSLKSFGINKKSVFFMFGMAFLYLIVCILLNLTKNWMDTCLCFPLGVAFGFYRKEITKYVNSRFYLLPLSFIIFAVTVFFSFGRETYSALFLRIISTIALIVLTLTILRYVDVSGNKFIAYIGTISLECYLVHGKVIRIVKLFFGDVNVLEMIVYLLSTTILTIGFVWILKKWKNVNRLEITR